MTKKTRRYRVLVTGCPRSGTKSMSNMLRQCGLDVLHERTGADGTVSTYFCVKKPTYIPRSVLNPHVGEPLPPKRRFETKIHLVRNPLMCIASAVKIVNRPHQLWMVEHGLLPPGSPLSKSKLWRMMYMWLSINSSVHQFADMRVRIEDEDSVDVILAHLGLKKPSRFTYKHMHKASGRNKPKVLTWDDLFKCDDELAADIYDMAAEYNYVGGV